MEQGGLELRTLRTKRWLSAVTLALVAAACGGGNPAETGGGGGGGDGGNEIQVGLAYDVGGRGDQSFNDAAYRGLQAAIDEGIVPEGNTDALEANQSGSNRDDNVVNLAEQGADLVIPVGFAFSEGIDEIAPDFPEVNFAVVDGFSKDQDNVSNLTFKEHEGSFLVGAAAALKSEAGTIGFLRGQAGPRFIDKFPA